MDPPNLDHCLGMLQKANFLKRMTFTPHDANYSDKIQAIQPYLCMFSTRFGMSSRALYETLQHRDDRFVRDGFHASDFDDWCRCLHKMSLFSVQELSVHLQQLQQSDPRYANLLHNLAQSVYLCLLYWCVPKQVLCEITRRASVGKRACIDVLEVDGLCVVKDWTVAVDPHRYQFLTLHTPSCTRVFSETFGLLTRHEIEPYAKPCCFPLVLRGLAQVLETLRTRTNVVEGEEEVEQMKN